MITLAYRPCATTPHNAKHPSKSKRPYRYQSVSYISLRDGVRHIPQSGDVPYGPQRNLQTHPRGNVVINNLREMDWTMPLLVLTSQAQHNRALTRIDSDLQAKIYSTTREFTCGLSRSALVCPNGVQCKPQQMPPITWTAFRKRNTLSGFKYSVF